MAVSKIAAELRRQMNTVANQERVSVIVRLKRERFSVQAALDSSPVVENKFRLFSGEVVQVKPAEIDTLSDQDEVDYIWPDLPVRAWLDTSVPHIEAPRVWSQTGFKGQGLDIAVIDTGIDASHPDFAGRIKAARSFVGGSAHDDNGHGTHVAGIVAGSGAKSGGKYVGVAPEATLHIAKALRADGTGSMSSVMAGIEWAVLEQRVQIVNLSLGGTTTCDGTDALSVLCDEAVLQAGVVMCVAAGNAGPQPQTIGPPGCARYVITVGAMTDEGQIAAFSSRGPSADGRTKPDIVFPGVDIVGPQAAGTQLGSVAAEGYVSMNGTSMATPHAAGVAALLLQANPQLTADQIKNEMLAGAVTLEALPNEQGAGQGNAYRAYLAAIDQEPASPSPDPIPPPPQPAPSKPPGCLAGLLGKRK